MSSLFCLFIFLWAVNGHSYLECADWRFNNPNKPGWLDTDGVCRGYARKFPIGMNQPFGEYDSIQLFRHYDQDPTHANPVSKAACNPNVESRTASIVNSYSPNKDRLGHTLGAMTEAPSGGLLCWRWAAKNHQHEDAIQYVDVNFDSAADVTADPTQTQLNQNTVARLLFKNCSRYPGLTYGTSYNNQRAADDNQPCGGCFQIPARNSGIYTVQWRWELNRNEVYTSCVDLKVNAANAVNPTSQGAANPVNPGGNPTSAANAIPGTTRSPVQVEDSCKSDCESACADFGVFSCNCTATQRLVVCNTNDVNFIGFSFLSLIFVWFFFN